MINYAHEAFLSGYRYRTLNLTYIINYFFALFACLAIFLFSVCVKSEENFNGGETRTRPGVLGGAIRCDLCVPFLRSCNGRGKHFVKRHGVCRAELSRNIHNHRSGRSRTARKDTGVDIFGSLYWPMFIIRTALLIF